MFTQKLLDYLKFLTSLTNRQIIVVLLAIIVAGQATIIYNLREDIKERDETIITNDVRCADNLSALQAKLSEEEKAKFKVVEDAQKYFRERFERLEEESNRNYRELEQIKYNKK